MTNRTKQIIIRFGTVAVGVGALAGGYGIYQLVTTHANQNKVMDDMKNNDYYNNLTEEEKDDFEQKLNDLVGSGYYKGLSGEKKDEIVDKFVESEKIQKEVKEEQEKQETRKEELKQELEDLSSNKQELEQRVQDLMDSGASEEEIKAAEQEQQKVEEQIKAAEQEQRYYEVIDSAKDCLQSDASKEYEGNFSIKQINGIYGTGSKYIDVDVDIIQLENIGGKEYYVQKNCFLTFRSTGHFNTNSSSDEIIKGISETSIIYMQECNNVNSQSHIEIFNNEISNLDDFSYEKENGYTLEVLKSWGEDEHPEFIIQTQKGEKTRIYKVDYTESKDRYDVSQILRICPEFWAQVEAEQAKEQNENMKNRSEFATLDANGNTTSFDYSAYLQKTNEQKTTVQETQRSYLFADELER